MKNTKNPITIRLSELDREKLKRQSSIMQMSASEYIRYLLYIHDVGIEEKQIKER